MPKPEKVPESVPKLERVGESMCSSPKHVKIQDSVLKMRRCAKT